jgi:hypothetical protein
VDIALDPSTHDLLLSPGGELSLTSGVPQAAAQRITIRLALFLGEWFLDTSAGVPYFQQILTQAPDDGTLRTLFRKHIEADPYVVAVTRVTVSIDRTTRVLSVSFDAQLTDGSELTVLISEGLLDGQVVVNAIGIFVNGVALVL